MFKFKLKEILKLSFIFFLCFLPHKMNFIVIPRHKKIEYKEGKIVKVEIVEYTTILINQNLED